MYGGVNNFGKLAAGTQSSNPPLLIDNGYLPGNLPREGVTKRKFAGTAVFSGDKMVGSLDSNETRYYLFVMGKYKKGMITIDDKEKPGNAIVVDLRLGRSPQIKSHFENGKPIIDIKLEVEGDVQSIQSRINYSFIL